MKSMISKVFLTLFALALTSTASAQPSRLDIADSRDWEHQWTDMVFPAEIGEFDRQEVVVYEPRETNVSARYLDSDGTIVSLYIYRPANASTSIWFDRALVAIGAPEGFGTVDLDELKIGRFTPNGGTAESGLSAVLAVRGNFRSTAVALYRADEWLVKVRISSRELSVSQMDVFLRNTLSGLPALDGLSEQPAQFVSQCTGSLSSQRARPVREDLGMTAMAQAIALVAGEQIVGVETDDFTEIETPGPTVAPYCREGARDQRFNVYRPHDGIERFTIAIGDSGFAIEVYPDVVSTQLAEGSDETVYAIRSATGLDYNLHTPFRGLPTLDQVAQSAMRGPVIASVNRPLEEGEDPQINLMVDLGVE